MILLLFCLWKSKLMALQGNNVHCCSPYIIYSAAFDHYVQAVSLPLQSFLASNHSKENYCEVVNQKWFLAVNCMTLPGPEGPQGLSCSVQPVMGQYCEQEKGKQRKVQMLCVRNSAVKREGLSIGQCSAVFFPKGLHKLIVLSVHVHWNCQHLLCK